ncbi:MAG: hypothetical protein HYS06_12250 [Methylocystis sp.]|nr:hypothetical protein [Methylocystis sp.]
MTVESTKRALFEGLRFSLAGIFIGETWLWDHGKIGVQTLVRHGGGARLETRLQSCVADFSPLLTFVAFLFPLALMPPLLQAALALMAEGHIWLGIVIALAGQTLVLATMAFLFELWRDKLFQMTWFAFLDGLILGALSRAEELVAHVWSRRREVLVFLRNHVEAACGREKVRFARQWTILRAHVASKANLS